MSRKLPARPDLEHLRSQAKTLLTQLRKDEKDAAASFIEHLPAARKMTRDEVYQANFRLADAQAVIARKTGFAKWPALVRHVEQLRQLEGTWEFVDLELDGNAMPAAALTNSHMLIDGDRFRMTSPEGTYEGVFTIDVEQMPHRIDIEFVEGPEAGNWSYGIFKLAGDKFKICLGLTGATRPLAFATAPGTGHALENLRRVLKARPEGVDGGTPQARPAETAAVDATAFDIAMTPVLKKLEGEWAPLELIQNGQALAKPLLAMGWRTTKGNETKVVFGGQVMLHVKVRINESQLPIAVDYLNVGRFSTGQVSSGIMEWHGDEVRFCMSAPGQPRASDFTCEPSSDRTLSRWKRK